MQKYSNKLETYAIGYLLTDSDTNNNENVLILKASFNLLCCFSVEHQKHAPWCPRNALKKKSEDQYTISDYLKQLAFAYASRNVGDGFTFVYLFYISD